MVAGERQLSHSTQGQAVNLLNAGAQSTLLFIQSRVPGNAAAAHVEGGASSLN